MRYDLSQLGDPHRFQRLVNDILVARFGEDARLTPLHGPDGGSDGETAPLNPNMEFRRGAKISATTDAIVQPPRPGRYLFQSKYHSTGDQRLSDLRTRVVGEFERELQEAVLRNPTRRDVNYFFVVTNLPASKEAQRRVDEVRKRLVDTTRNLHADIWWGERVTASLDWSPSLWPAFPELFPGQVPPLLIAASSPDATGSPRTFRAALSAQYGRHRTVKFRQIELEQQLLELFVDLDVEFPSHTTGPLVKRPDDAPSAIPLTSPRDLPESALELLLDDELAPGKVLLEGGPGQGKSTITQMTAQIYREKVLRISDSRAREPNWQRLCRLRLPIHLELASCAHWLAENHEGTLDEYIAYTISRDSGGVAFPVAELHQFLSDNPVMLILDGLDEVGSDPLRDRLLDAIGETIDRFERGLRIDLRVVLTSRPPALRGRRAKLSGFFRVLLTSMTAARIDDYRERWLSVRIEDQEERDRITSSFERRRRDPHVEALARNPMQLSVLLQLIHLKGEAFPDRRADLYGEYFKKVIDRDVEKSPQLREYRDLVHGLHCFLGFHFQGMMEIERGHGAFVREEVISLASKWLAREGHPRSVVEKFFALGEERFGLIVAFSGEGADATYGFEVRPVQEYFAASYISDRLPAQRAHEIFELLVHRNYWREVALFLAGLRRPNEKADLVARAKATDRGVSDTHHMPGRNIILQLLREGVLDQSRPVLVESMRAVVELLEIDTLRFQRNPEGLVEAVCELAERHEYEAMGDVALRLAQECCDSEDEELLRIVYGVAARFVTSAAYGELLSEYKGAAPLARSVVYMSAPYAVAGVVEGLSKGQNYWSAVPMTVWAGRLWRAVRRHGRVAELVCPRRLHESLAVEFAFDRAGWADVGGIALGNSSVRPLAVWRLQQNIDVMHQHVGPAGAGRPGAVASTLEYLGFFTNGKAREANYEGLGDDLESCFRSLVGASDKVVVALAEYGAKKFRKAIETYLDTIEGHLSDQGLGGWIACRCGGELLEATGRLRDSRVRDRMSRITEIIGGFYGIEDAGPRFGPPTAVRMMTGAEVVPVHDIMADMVMGKGEALGDEWAWIREITLNATMIKPLVEACRGHLWDLLSFVGRREVVGVWPRAGLSAEDVSRIWEICDSTDEGQILAGAAAVLWTSDLAYVGDVELLRKVVGAAPSGPLAWTLFNPMREHVPRDEGQRRESQKVARAVAEAIVRDADRHPFRLVNGAANLLAETEGGRGAALFEECPEIVVEE